MTKVNKLREKSVSGLDEKISTQRDGNFVARAGGIIGNNHSVNALRDVGLFQSDSASLIPDILFTPASTFKACLQQLFSMNA